MIAFIKVNHTTTEVTPDQSKTSSPDHIKSSKSSDVTKVKNSSSAEPSSSDNDKKAAHKKETSLPEQHSKSEYLDATSSLRRHNTTDATQNKTNVPLEQPAKGTDTRNEKKASSSPEQSTTNRVTTDQGKTQQCTSKTHETSAKKESILPDQNATDKNAVEHKKELSPEKTSISEAVSHEKDNSTTAVPTNVSDYIYAYMYSYIYVATHIQCINYRKFLLFNHATYVKIAT